MPVISPNAFAPPVASRAANDAAPVPADLRERIRRLERAHSAQRAGQAAVPLGVPAIDALLPEGGLLTGALHEIEAGPAPSGRVASHDGAALGFAAHLLGRFGAKFRGTLLWCRRPSGTFDAPPYAAGALRLVRSGAPADGHGAARRGSVLGDGRGPALPRHRRRPGRDARGRSHRRPPPVARRREERRARPAAALPAGATAKRLHDALAHRLGAVALDARPHRPRRRALAPRAQTQPLRRAVRRRDPILARGVER